MSDPDRDEASGFKRAVSRFFLSLNDSLRPSQRQRSKERLANFEVLEELQDIQIYCELILEPKVVPRPPAASREHGVSQTEAETSQSDPKLETGHSKDSPTAFQPEDSPITPKTMEHQNQNSPPSVKRKDEVSDEPNCNIL